MAFIYLAQTDFAKPVASLLYAYGGLATIAMYDPYWISTTQNKAAVDVVSVNGNNEGLNASGQVIAYRTIKPGLPTVDISAHTGLASPNNATYRGNTAGSVNRATGVQVDAAGRVGFFINGFDTPSDLIAGVPKSFGPDIHLSRSYASGPVYLGAGSTQEIHVSCRLTVGTAFFSPTGGASPGLGGQIGWRLSVNRVVGGVVTPFRAGLTEIVLLVGLFESRAVGDPGNTGLDSTGNVTQGETWCSGTIAPGQTSRYVVNRGANSFNGPAGNKVAQFYWSVSRQNMRNILDDFNCHSVTPEEVRITGTTFSSEIWDNRPDAQKTEFKPAQLGFSIEGQSVAVW